MSAMPVSLDAAVEASRTGDLWLFRGQSGADRWIQTLTNAPVNHVGMALVIEDMPPMIWHAELGRSLPDRWTNDRHRGVQLHDLRDAVEVWGRRYGQRAWLRQLEPEVSREAEDAALQVVARLDGVPFPSTAQLAGRWLRGRIPTRARRARAEAETLAPDRAQALVEPSAEPWFASFPWHHEPVDPVEIYEQDDEPEAATGRFAALSRWVPGALRPGRAARRVEQEAEAADARAEQDAPLVDGRAALETAYCAEVVALTYQAMGLLPGGRRPNWYDPGRFWSGDDLPLAAGYALGAEIAVEIPPGP